MEETEGVASKIDLPWRTFVNRSLYTCALLPLLLTTISLPGQSNTSLGPTDLLSWKSIEAVELSPDGEGWCRANGADRIRIVRKRPSSQSLL
jgi:hypothetical protein